MVAVPQSSIDSGSLLGSVGAGSVGLGGEVVDPTIFVDEMSLDRELTVTNDYFSSAGEESFTFQFPSDWTVETYPSGLVSVVNDPTLIENNPMRNRSLAMLPDQAVIEFLFQDAIDYGFDGDSLLNPNFVAVITQEFIFAEEIEFTESFTLLDRNVVAQSFEREDGTMMAFYLFDLPDAGNPAAFGILFALGSNPQAQGLPLGLINSIRAGN